MSEKVQKAIQAKVLDLLAEGVIPWKKNWNHQGGSAAKNIVTNKCYRGTNYFLLNCQGYESPYWMTYKQAKDHGGYVKKGEKSTVITVFRPFKPKKGEEEQENKWRRGYWGCAWVFNLAQTEDVKVPKREEAIVKRYDNTPLENCEKILADFPDPPETIWGLNPCYKPSLDQIGMPEKDQFKTIEDYYDAFFHERGHSTKHLTRLNRDAGSYAKEELIAEMTACFLCAEAGIERTVIENQVAYIDHWRKKISEDPKLIMQAASEAQKSANYCMGINEFTEMKESA